MKKLLVFISIVISIYSYAQNAEDALKQGDTLSNEEKYNEAITKYTEAITIDKEMSNAYLQRAYAYLRLKDYNNAINDYSEVIKLNPENSFAYLSRGSAYNKTKKFDKALIDFDKVLEINPEDQEGYNNRGWAKKGLGNKKGACKDWKKSKKLGNREAKIIYRNNGC